MDKLNRACTIDANTTTTSIITKQSIGQSDYSKTCMHTI